MEGQQQQGGGETKKRKWQPPAFIQKLIPMPITEDGYHPNKRFYRSRAHCNPLSHNDCYEYPSHPEEIDWTCMYPSSENPVVRLLDVGCGFGGLTITLSKLFPDKHVLGLEIREKVCEFVRLRIEELRKEKSECMNGAVLRTNAMKYLPNFFHKGQLEKIFFCFPDPHFKAKNHRRRIISEVLLSEYAYFLQEGGLLYAITDVLELHEWHVEKLTAHPCFERIPDESLEGDATVQAVRTETEESKKVERANKPKYLCVFKRRTDAEIREIEWPVFTAGVEEDGGGDD